MVFYRGLGFEENLRTPREGAPMRAERELDGFSGGRVLLPSHRFGRSPRRDAAGLPFRSVGRRERGPRRRPGGAVEPIMPGPGRRGWADLLTLVGGVRRLAFDRNLPPSEALGRIRDAFRSYDEGSTTR